MADATLLPSAFAHPRIAVGKITEYLLNPHHPEGASKARFFTAFGFTLAEPDAFISALFGHAALERFVRRERTVWGDKFIFEGPIETPDRRNPRIRSIWQTLSDDPFPTS